MEVLEECGRVSTHQLSTDVNPLSDLEDTPGDLTDEQLDALTRGNSKTYLIARLSS